MNEWQKRRFAMNIVSAMFNTVSGKKLAVLGFAYKKNTSDTRHTPARDVCATLLAERASLSIHDPRVMKEAISVALTDVDGAERLVAVESDPYLACQNAHALIVLTEWDQFNDLDFHKVYASMQKPAFVFDGRNLLDHDELRAIGFHVYGIGKPAPQRDQTEEERLEAERSATAEAGRLLVGATKLETAEASGATDGDAPAGSPGGGSLEEGSDAPGLPGLPPGPGRPARSMTSGSIA